MDLKEEILKLKIELAERNNELLKERIIKYLIGIQQIEGRIDYNQKVIENMHKHFNQENPGKFDAYFWGYGCRLHEYYPEFTDETRMDRMPINIDLYSTKLMGNKINLIKSHSKRLNEMKLIFIEKIGINKYELNKSKENLKKLNEKLKEDHQDDNNKLVEKPNENKIERKEISDKNSKKPSDEDPSSVKKENPNKGITKRIDELIGEHKLEESDKYTNEICDDVCEILRNEGFEPNWRSVYSILNKKGINNIEKKHK